MLKVKKFVKTVVAFVLAGAIIIGFNFIHKIKIFPQNSSANDFLAGRASNECQILELWHLETFEGGTASRSAWLNKRALEFEKKNNNIFILVKTLSLDEFKNHIALGELPDLISFGSGVDVNSISNFLAPLDKNNFKAVNNSLLSSGMKNNELLAVSYMFSGYSLISTSLNDELSLKDNVFNSFEVIKTRKGEKPIYSLIYGGGGLTSPKETFNFSSATNSLAVFPESNQLSSYEAYCQFLLGKAKILSGTMRDIARLEARLNNGEFSSLRVEGYTNFTDMVSYLSVVNNQNAQKLAWGKTFVDFIMGEACQKTVKLVGQLSPTLKLYADGFYSIVERSYSEIACKNIFY